MKLWFNHWFSTVYNIITSIKEEFKEELIIIGSNEKKDAVYKVLCDEWYQEPVFKEGEKYEEKYKNCNSSFNTYNTNSYSNYRITI